MKAQAGFMRRTEKAEIAGATSETENILYS